MREFMISTAAMTAFTVLLASAPAKADHNFGPIQNGNQCWTIQRNLAIGVHALGPRASLHRSTTGAVITKRTTRA
jgi:hypothetical protein